MVNMLDYGLSSLGLCPSQGHYILFSGKTLTTLTVPLSTQVYKWVNLLLEVTLQWTGCIPSGGGGGGGGGK